MRFDYPTTYTGTPPGPTSKDWMNPEDSSSADSANDDSSVESIQETKDSILCREIKDSIPCREIKDSTRCQETRNISLDESPKKKDFAKLVSTMGIRILGYSSI